METMVDLFELRSTLPASDFKPLRVREVVLSMIDVDVEWDDVAPIVMGGRGARVWQSED